MMQEFHHPGDPVADILFNWLPFLGLVVFGCVGAFLILRGYRLYLKSAFLNRDGQPGAARVVKKWIVEGHVDRNERHRTKAVSSHFLRYQLQDDARAFSADEVAPSDLWKRLEPGDAVDVIVHPRRKLMRLAAWKTHRGANAGALQMAMGAVAMSAALATILMGAYNAIQRAEPKVTGPDWRRDKAEILAIGAPADPYLRIFAPGTKLIQVVFGDTAGGAFMANQRVIRVTAKQIDAYSLSNGATLAAWIDPANEYNAILELERPEIAHR